MINNRKNCLENVKQQFEKIQVEVDKLHQYTEITPDFLVNAYTLAKWIQEKYAYQLKGSREIEKIFKKLGVMLDFRKCEIQIIDIYDNANAKLRKTTDSVIIALAENTIKISIYCNIHYLYREYWSKGEISYLKERTYENNRVFCYFYAVAIIVMFYKRLEEGKSMKFNYGECNNYSIEEEKAITLALFLLYLKYDNDYRTKKYPNVNERGKVVKELQNVHPCFSDPYVYADIYHIFFGRKSKCHTERINIGVDIYCGQLEDFLTTYTLNKMIANVAIIENYLKEKYNELSKMIAPKKLYSIYKDTDYTKFPELRQIDY